MQDARSSLDLEALRAWIVAPVAIQLAACGEGLAPQSVRGFGVSFDDSGALRVGIVDEQCPKLLAALRVGQPLAVNLTHPLTFHGRQFKGPLLELQEPSAEAAQAAQQYFGEFTELVAKIGLTPVQCRGFFKTGATRFLRMKPEQMFDQTPGASAGQRL